VDGGKIPPVHVITFGSPCQNLSLIGNRSGLAGAKSSLFYQAFRIIQEMRDANLTEIAAVTDVLIFIRDGKIIKIVENDYNEKELEALYEDIMTSGQREEA